MRRLTISRLTISLSAGLIGVLVCGLLSAHAWSTQVDILNNKLQTKQDEIIKLKSDIKSLKADNQLKDEKIVKLESRPQ